MNYDMSPLELKEFLKTELEGKTFGQGKGILMSLGFVKSPTHFEKTFSGWCSGDNFYLMNDNNCKFTGVCSYGIYCKIIFSSWFCYNYTTSEVESPQNDIYGDWMIFGQASETKEFSARA